MDLRHVNSSRTVMDKLDLTGRYGPLMDAFEVAAVLRFPTREALMKSVSRGTTPLEVHRMPGRRRVFFATAAVQSYLEITLVPKATISSSQHPEVEKNAPQNAAASTEERKQM
jgi:hypothetical protein